jgi:PAS domain S-box-containing protein
VELDSGGNPLRIIGTSFDISAQKNAELIVQKYHEQLERQVEERTAELERALQDLKQKTEEQALLLNTIDVQVWYLTDPGTYGLVNQSTADFLGVQLETIPGKRLSEFYSPDVVAVWEASNTEVFQSRQTVYTEELTPNAAGEPRWMSITKTPKLDQYGNVEYVVCAGTDITERKRLEEENLEMERKLLHAQKLESLAVMAGGIAHDFNNQLAVVLGNLELGLMDLAPDSVVRPSVMNAIQAAKRSAELCRQIQIYTGNTFYNPLDLDLNELLNTNPIPMQLRVSRNVTLNLESHNTLPPIKGDPDQIQCLVTNILVNASEAVGDKNGEVRLSTGVIDCDAEYLSRSRIEEKPEPGRFVFLEVTDTGYGMDADTQRRLFDPFFSTKFWGRGLGMSKVIGITKGHHGAIIVDSEVGKGTTIRVLFPVQEEVQDSFVTHNKAAETKSPVSDIARRKTILVVEDETGVRDLAVRRLDVLGYDTIVAGDGEEGVNVFRERPNEIDLVMLDFKMPKMNGVETFGELIRIKPDVRVMLCSGYTEDVVMQSFPGQRPAVVLHKPYNMEELKTELDRLLS